MSMLRTAVSAVTRFMRQIGPPVVVTLGILLFVTTGAAGPREPGLADRDRAAKESVAPTSPRNANLANSAALVDTTVVASYTFDTGGAPDPQGWTTHDLTLQTDTFFHVAGAAELDGGNGGTLVPLEGAQSLWCGLALSGDPPTCSYATSPGYGNNWRQRFDLTPLHVAGDVTVTYRVRWYTEPGYDDVIVEYPSPCATSWTGWNRAPVNGGVGYYDGTGDLVESFTIPDSCVNDTLRLRFDFKSDGAWSDEDGLYPSDGAVLVDSIVIADTTGIVDYQDFESELPGALITTDGRWYATVGEAFGDFAALHAGSTVVQQDTLHTNTTHFWGFFDEPTEYDYYQCDGEYFPQQGIVPEGHDDVNSSRYYCIESRNEVWSPPIPISSIGDDMVLSFRVYRDMPLDGLLFYVWHVRSWVGGCPGPWKDEGFVYYGGHKDWHDASFSIRDHIDPAAQYIQVAVGVKDMCGAWCNFGCGDGEACHRHAPLIDDVAVMRIDTTGTPADVPPNRDYLVANYPNPFNPSTTIGYGTVLAGRVSLKVYDVRGRLVRTLEDAFRAPGEFVVQWDGKTDTGTPVASGVYFYRLVAPGFAETKKMVLLK